MKTETLADSPLKTFCQRNQISRSKLSEICGGSANDASQTTIQRLLHNELDADYTKRLRLILAQKLPQYLFNLGLSAAEIDNQLLQVFDKGEYQPMITERTELPKEVAQFFGFINSDNKPIDPFEFPKDRAEVFMNPSLKAVFDSVIDAIKYQGFKYVSGEIGSGKDVMVSTIKDYVAKKPNLRLIFPETFEMSRVTPANISRAILEEFESSHIPNDAVSRAKKVKNVLARAYKDGIRVAIAFNECHRLNDIAISSLKNFLEMNSGGFQKYLGVVLFGQPSFVTRLSEPRFREIFERITPIKMPEFRGYSLDYFTYKLNQAGTDINQLFDQDAIDLVIKNADTPLALGNIANAALIHSCSFKNKKVIGAAIRTKMFFAETRQFSKKAGK